MITTTLSMMMMIGRDTDRDTDTDRICRLNYRRRHSWPGPGLMVDDQRARVSEISNSRGVAGLLLNRKISLLVHCDRLTRVCTCLTDMLRELNRSGTGWNNVTRNRVRGQDQDQDQGMNRRRTRARHGNSKIRFRLALNLNSSLSVEETLCWRSTWKGRKREQSLTSIHSYTHTRKQASKQGITDGRNERKMWFAVAIWLPFFGSSPLESTTCCL